MKKVYGQILAGALCAASLALCGKTAALAAQREAQTALYGIGSTSKVYTAAAVLQLAERGLIDLDAPLTDALPGFTMADERYRQITARMLLDHSSGLQGSNYRDAMLLGDSDTAAHDSLLEQLSLQRLKAPPGAFSVYCNDGFSLAEQLIEQVSGMSFTEYLQQNLLDPLGLSHTATPQSDFDRDLLAPIYQDGTERLPAENTGMIGSGGLYATAEDVCRFARVFMPSYTGDVLSRESACLMEQAAFAGGVWDAVPDAGAAMAYGLGWDTVNEHPFGEYGIQAVAKGGDTTAYHASLIVLPEKELSCTVLSSGGSGAFCSAAAKEILLEYLRETGRLPEKSAPVQKRAGEEAAGGWYVSRQQAMRVAVEEEALTLTTAGTSRDTRQRYVRQGGLYRSSDGAYISPEGKLVEAQDGVRGQTALSFRRGEDGTFYLLADTVETLPGLGQTRGAVPIAQRVEPHPLPEAVAQRWKEREAGRYYLISDKHTSAFYLQNPSTVPRMIEGLPGYCVLDDSGPCALLTRIEDMDSARFFQTIPGQAGRDLCDLRFYREDGVEKLDMQNYRFIPETAVQPIGERREAVIGARGETLWFSAQGARSAILTAPENGSFYVYSVEREGLVCTASSLTGMNGRTVRLPDSCRIAFAGEAGAQCAIEWVEG